MSYSDILKINKNFQYSINIEYDLFDHKKIKDYIPTTDVCDILKIYINTILGKEKEKATILVGPYGKGKSFLVWTLLQLVCFDNIYVEEFLTKVKFVDIELYNLIKEYQKSKMKLLPIIIDSNYYNIDQSFLLGLDEALKHANLKNIIPTTIYSVCLELLDKWITDKELNKKAFDKCLYLNGITIDELKRELKSFDLKGYKHFESLYNCITPGLNFNPMINTDIVKTYSDIVNQLKDFGYNGIFIIYDEFSKTIDNNNDFLSKDLKIIQDFAEIANRSKQNNQMHLCCITHKSLSLYQEDKKDLLKESFKTVEGRFKEIHFNRSLDQNYQIISFTLKKMINFENIYNKFYNDNISFYTQLDKLNLFDETDKTLLYKGCFPFNPISVYALVQLSEMVAQNERTMFTLISDNDESSFNSFLSNQNDGLYNLDMIYDYFNNTFSSSEQQIKAIWYKCESSLSQVNKNLEKRVLKALACIRMVNDFSKFTPDIDTLALCLFESKEIVERCINKLIEERLLKTSFGNSYLDFSFSSAKEIDLAVENFLNSKRGYKKDSIILDQLCKEKYFLPRKYNTEYKMTRFFKSKFINLDEFLNINAFDPYFENEKCDGFVFNLIDSKISTERVKEKYYSIKGNEKVIIRFSKADSNLILKEARIVDALNMIKDNPELSELTRTQVKLILNEKQKDIIQVLTDLFKTSNIEVISSFGGKSISEICSQICYQLYPYAPIINVEMINKSEVSTAYEKARNKVIESILQRKSIINDYSKTSPEMTVYNAFFNEKNELSETSKNIVNSIKQYLQSNLQLLSMEEIVNKYIEPPYGIRLGILPMFFAIAISNMNDNVILYYEKKEIDINSSNLDKMCHDPERYRLIVEPKSEKQEVYLKKIISIFKGIESDSYYLNVHQACELIRRWFIDLPIVLKELKLNDNFINVNEQFFKLKDIFLRFDINEYEVMIKEIPSIFENDYDVVIDYFINKDSIFESLNIYLFKLASEVKKIFGYEDYLGSLNSCFKDWISMKHIDVRNLIFEASHKSLIAAFDNLSYDDTEAINQLSSAALKYRIEDWTRNNEKYLYKEIKSLKERLDKSDVHEQVHLNFKHKKREISPIGKSFKNNIEAIIDEYNDAIPNEEKAYILMEMLNKFTGGDL